MARKRNPRLCKAGIIAFKSLSGLFVNCIKRIGFTDSLAPPCEGGVSAANKELKRYLSFAADGVVRG
jgi:hypothetical protein